MSLTPKQESFCLRYVELGNASEAYRQAYDADNMKAESVHRTAKELLDNPKIAARVKELQDRHLKRHDVTVDSLTLELEEARAMALANIQPSAAVSATMGKAKIHGHLTDRTEITGKDGKPIEYKRTDLSEDELNARILELAAKAGAGGAAGAAGAETPQAGED